MCFFSFALLTMGLCASAELSVEQQAQVDAAKYCSFISNIFLLPLAVCTFLRRERSRNLDKEMQAQDQADAQVLLVFVPFLHQECKGEQIITSWGWGFGEKYALQANEVNLWSWLHRARAVKQMNEKRVESFLVGGRMSPVSTTM